MRISTNLEALNAGRSLARASSRQSVAMQRLSSGLRINTAADDAAGYAISQGLTAQVNGLDQAARNAQDATSLLQTADGALGQVTAMLQRVRELAVQYHNGTLSDADRQSIQAEADQLGSEVLNVADKTQFNGIPLFPRSGAPTLSFQVGANDGETIGITLPSLRDVLGVTGITKSAREFVYQPQASDSTIDVDSIHKAADGTSTTTHQSFLIPANSTVDEAASIINNDPNSQIEATTNHLSGMALFAEGWGPDYDLLASAPSLAEMPERHDLGEEVATPFELGSYSDISRIDAAIDAVSQLSGQFGATQNRLEYVTQNVATYHENLSAAESGIRDADVAQESVEMTKASILSQAATMVLAQANQAPRQLMSLLNS
jgi:flagellin